MPTLNDFFYTDFVDDVLAVIVNRLIAGNLRGELAETKAITATLALTDGDLPIQNLTANVSSQIVNLPLEAINNHVVVIRNAGATYSLIVKDNAGAVTFATITPGQMIMAIPIGGLTWQCLDMSKGSVLSAEIDFGSIPTYSKTFTVSSPGITTSHKIVVTQSAEAATGRSQDENEMDALILSAVAGTDQFTLYATAVPGPVTGKYKINYSFN
jgi:hypothetical protein